MDREYHVFDLENANVIPDDEGAIKAHRLLGISRAASLVGEDGAVP